MEAGDTEQDAGVGEPLRGRDRRLLGLVLIGLGSAWFLSESHLLALSAETVLSGLLILLALGLIYTARRGRRMGRWPILLGAGLTIFLIANSPSLHFPSVRRELGDTVIAPKIRAGLQFRDRKDPRDGLPVPATDPPLTPSAPATPATGNDGP